MGFNNYAVLSAGSIVTKLALFSLGADRLVFLAPMQSPDLQKGAAGVPSPVFPEIPVQRRRQNIGSLPAPDRRPERLSRARVLSGARGSPGYVLPPG
ncbi:MAG: hypothetical protein MZU97_18860 [Bacillus subtilis]|nr:hypothetical protein [Bacillus subtilis]